MRIKQKNIRIVIAVLFVVSFITLLIGGVNAAETPNPVIRVGLHYGTGSMDGLNLKNEVGTGFRFGYYEQNNQFVALGSTEQQAISIVLTKNVYYGSYNGYTSYHTALTSSSVAVGAYHLQIAYDDIVVLIRGEEGADQIRLALGSYVRTEIEFTVHEKDGKPVQNGVISIGEVQNGQAVSSEGIPIDKAILCHGTGPLFCYFQSLCAVEAEAVIMERIPLAKLGVFQD